MNHKLIAILSNPFGIFIFALISLSFIWQTVSRYLSSQYLFFGTNLVGGLAFIVMMLLLWRTYKKRTEKRVRSYAFSFEHVFVRPCHAINHLNELSTITHRQVSATHNRFLIASALSLLRDT